MIFEKKKVRWKAQMISAAMKFCLAVIAVIGFSGCLGDNQKSFQNHTDPRLWTVADKEFVLRELDRTTDEVLSEISDLSSAQWYFQENPDRWSIAEITEHLELQNELHFREIYAASQAPQMLEFIEIVSGWDSVFSAYATDTTRGVARWFLEPLGRFCDHKSGVQAFQRVRSNLKNFVQTTDVDLRKQFTFRRQLKDWSEARPGDVRDLHQLLLTGIAHTDRHLIQIRNVKKDPTFPEN